MAATVTVLYPNHADATFDMDYYLARHMPMVMERFGAHGMTGWRVTTFEGPPSAPPSALWRRSPSAASTASRRR